MEARRPPKQRNNYRAINLITTIKFTLTEQKRDECKTLLTYL